MPEPIDYKDPRYAESAGEILRREERFKVTVTIAHRELRKSLRESTEGRRVEEVVGRLLGEG